MRLNRVSLSLALIVASAVLAPAWAHHSHGNYLRTVWVYLSGTVREVRWMNPHSWVYLEVADADGEPAIWALEGAAVTTLRREGWTVDSVKAGDEISVRCHQLADGQNGCLLGYITNADGVEKEFD